MLNDASVRDAFMRHDVARMRADWTRRDPVISHALAALGRDGVPVYALYRRDRPPHLFPEVLKRATVVDALAAN